MNPKLLSVAIGTVVLMCRPRLTVATHGIGFSVPLVLVAVLGIAGACLVLAALIIRGMLRASGDCPHMHDRTATT